MFIIFILLVLFIIALMTVGICIGLGHLMIFFIPTLELNNALTPAAILTTILTLIIASTLRFWISDAIRKVPLVVPHRSNYDDDDYDDDDDDDEPPVVTKKQPYRNRKNWR